MSELNTPRQQNDSNKLYNQDYLNWKSWKSSNFGKINKVETAYFNAETRRICSKLTEGSKILEIGFGEGKFLQYCQQQQWEAIGTETNEDLVQIAKTLGYSAIHTDNLLSFPDNEFDLIAAFDVLEHIPQEEIPKMLNQIRRILKSDGFFLARFPNGDSPFGMTNQNGDVSHVTTIGMGKIHYFAEVSHMDLHFKGGEARTFAGVSKLQITQKILSHYIKKMIDFFVNIVFFPRANLPFCSSNLVVILKKKSN